MSAAIALVFKVTESGGLNRYAVTSANYLVASAVAAALLAAAGPLPREEVRWGVKLGLAAGGVFCLAFLYYQVSVNRHGVGLSGAFAKMGILVPMALSLVLWREAPDGLEWAGMALAVAAIALANWPGGGTLRQALRPALLLLFLFGGIAEFSNKVFQRYGVVEARPVFLLATFLTAFVLSLLAVAWKRRRVTLRDLAGGVAVGVPNFFSSYFLIRALEDVPAAVAFPLYGAGTILVVAVAGILVFGERPDRRETLAILLTMAALVLVNL